MFYSVAIYRQSTYYDSNSLHAPLNYSPLDSSTFSSSYPYTRNVMVHLLFWFQMSNFVIMQCLFYLMYYYILIAHMMYCTIQCLWKYEIWFNLVMCTKICGLLFL